MHISVRRDTPLCEDFKAFMRDSDNKAELLLMIANSVSQIKDIPTSIIATVNEKVIANDFDKILKILCLAIKKRRQKINSSCF